jgi:hypothetical protein
MNISKFDDYRLTATSERTRCDKLPRAAVPARNNNRSDGRAIPRGSAQKNLKLLVSGELGTKRSKLKIPEPSKDRAMPFAFRVCHVPVDPPFRPRFARVASDKHHLSEGNSVAIKNQVKNECKEI